MKVALAQINPIIGSFKYNLEKILEKIEQAKAAGCELIVFPEMAVCGYPPEDLLLLPSFIEAVSFSLEEIRKKTKGITAVVGCVRKNPSFGEKFLLNSAAIFQEGKLLGFQDKSLLPDYDVFSERRYFEPVTKTRIWQISGKKIGITICEDIWQHADEVIYARYPRDPVLELKAEKPDLLINLSSSPYYLRRHETRLKVCQKAAKTLNCPVLFCNQVGGNDVLIFDGFSLVLNSKGELILHGKAFEEDLLIYDSETSYPLKKIEKDPMEELYQALVLGVRDYFHKLKFTQACLGLSGGIDSSLVACIAKEALGKENVLAISMPSRFTSKESKDDARKMAANLGIEFKELSIEEPFQCYLDLLAPHSFGKKIDISEENLQARIRGTLLMAFSNKYGYIVLATGNKSELAMGYSTLYGDMCGGLEVIGDLTKNQVYALSKWINQKKEIIPKYVLERAPSAELRPNQKDTDTLPEYSILDVVLKDYVEEHLSSQEIAEKHNLPFSFVLDLVKKIHDNEYKRRQAPPALRVTKKSFAMGRRFPIVHGWDKEIERHKTQ